MHGMDPLHDQIVTSDQIYVRHPPYWDYVCDSADNAILVGIPISFHTVVMQDNYSELEEIAKCMHYYSETLRKPTSWHLLRFVKQGRGLNNSEQALNEKQVENLPKLIHAFLKRYNLDITCSDSFAGITCNCKSLKQVITCYGESIPCSALKYGGKEKKFGCKDRL